MIHLQQKLIMDFVPLLQTKKKAMADCQSSPDLSSQRQNLIKSNLELLTYAPWAVKGTIFLGIVFGVNWKKPAPITKRQLPLALGAIAVSALCDFALMDYVWRQHESEVVKLTGYKDGIWVSPERLKMMRSKMGAGSLLSDKGMDSEDQFMIEDEM